jgi:hypothetical protein
MSVRVCMCVCVCMCVFVWVGMCVFVYREYMHRCTLRYADAFCSCLLFTKKGGGGGGRWGVKYEWRRSV